jgi:Restriction endonuclease S subunits
MTAWPLRPLSSAVRQQRATIEVADLLQYRRPRVRQWGAGAVLRDEVWGGSIKTKRQQVCRTDQLLVAEIDAKVGGFAIVPEELDGAIVSSHYFLFDIDQTKLVPAFLGWFLRTAQFQDQVRAQGSTNYAAIRPADVLRCQIPLPDRDEQLRVVGNLGRIHGDIVQTQALLNDSLEAVNRLVLASAMTARDQSWPLRPLLDTAVLLDAMRVPVNASERLGRSGTVPYFGAGGQVGWIDRALFDEPLLLLAEDAGPFDENCGYLIDGPTWVNNHAHVLRGTGASNEWLLWMLRTTDLRPFLSGSTRPKLTQSALRRIAVPIAPKPVQARLTASWARLEALAIEARSRVDEEMRDAAALWTAVLHSSFASA